jgi:hypothetical protein
MAEGGTTGAVSRQSQKFDNHDRADKTNER